MTRVHSHGTMSAVHARAALLIPIFAFTCIVMGNDNMMLNEGNYVPLELGVETSVQQTLCNQYGYFRVNVTVEHICMDLKVEIKGITGQPDLYIGKQMVKEPSLDHITWTSYEWGHESLTISHWDPEFEVGEYYIGVLAYCGSDVATGNTNASYTVKASAVTTTEISDHKGVDILDRPQLNHLLDANAYQYYHFCVPHNCADIKVTLDNCLDPAACPDSYAWPELLVSRSIPKPTINDHSFKLAQIDRRYVEISAKNPDFRPGHWWVAVFGWCTPDEHCVDKSVCGPCDYAANTRYNLTVEATVQPDSECEERTYQVPAPATQSLVAGETVRGQGECNTYTYFAINVTEPCKDLRVEVEAIKGQPDLYVGKSPVVRPTLDDITWTSYEWGAENVTISHWDPEFQGGYVCGPGADEVCTYYIGILSYCGADVATGDTASEFDLTVHVVDTADNIIDSVVTDQRVGANAYQYYHFCVADPNVDVRVALINPLDPCQCPDSYSWPELLVSRTNREPTINDYAWKLAQIERRSVTILADDPAARVGHYFVGVFGWCTPDEHCVHPCECGPCANVERSTFALQIDTKPRGEAEFPALSVDGNSCPAPEKACDGGCCPGGPGSDPCDGDDTSTGTSDDDLGGNCTCSSIDSAFARQEGSIVDLKLQVAAMKDVIAELQRNLTTHDHADHTHDGDAKDHSHDLKDLGHGHDDDVDKARDIAIVALIFSLFSFLGVVYLLYKQSNGGSSGGPMNVNSVNRSKPDAYKEFSDDDAVGGGISMRDRNASSV